MIVEHILKRASEAATAREAHEIIGSAARDYASRALVATTIEDASEAIDSLARITPFRIMAYKNALHEAERSMSPSMSIMRDSCGYPVKAAP